MIDQVSFEGTLVSSPVGAFGASERFLPRVRADVGFHVPFLGEGGGAVGALVWLLLGVSEVMLLQVGLMEGLVRANGASVHLDGRLVCCLGHLHQDSLLYLRKE